MNKTNVKLLFVGDIVIKHVPQMGIITDGLRTIIQEHDLVSCNFEAPIIDENCLPIPKAGPHVFQCKEAPSLVLEAGFNIINLANNHIYDYGENGLERTLKAFEKEVTVIGAARNFNVAYNLKIIEVSDIKIGLLSYCEAEFGALTDEFQNRGGYAWVNHRKVNNMISNSCQKVDFLIIQIHAGAEEVELPLPEWRDRYRELIDSGADVIIGHHPHVPQGWEIYKSKPIFYSLGNFYFDADKMGLWNKSYGVSFELNKNAMKFQILPFEKSYFGVIINTESSFQEYLNNLTNDLNTKDYLMKANKQALQLWNERYKNYYIQSISNPTIWDYSLKSLAKIMIKKMVYKIRNKKKSSSYKINRLLLLHNIRIETHRWTTERALSLIEERDSCFNPLKN